MTESSGARGVRIIDDSKSRYHIFAFEKPDSFYISYEDMKKRFKKLKSFQNLWLWSTYQGMNMTLI